MEGIAQLVGSIATLLWPLLVIIVLLIFRKSLLSLIKTGESRGFSVKIGDMEVSMDELSKQQGDMIKDLQMRINTIQKDLDAMRGLGGMESAPEPDFEAARGTEEMSFGLGVDTKPHDEDIQSILWVDDKPVNNAFLIDSLKYKGIEVSTAKSTQDALEHFKHGSFDCVITDLTRSEGGVMPNRQAGFELASAIRELDEEIPVYIYTAKFDEKMRQKAREVGAKGITNSPSELLNMLGD